MLHACYPVKMINLSPRGPFYICCTNSVSPGIAVMCSLILKLVGLTWLKALTRYVFHHHLQLFDTLVSVKIQSSVKAERQTMCETAGYRREDSSSCASLFSVLLSHFLNALIRKKQNKMGAGSKNVSVTVWFLEFLSCFAACAKIETGTINASIQKSTN